MYTSSWVIGCFCAAATHGSSVATITAATSGARRYKYEEDFIEALLMRWIVAALLVFSATDVQAQSRGTHGYVFAGSSMPWEEGATTNESRTYIEAPGGWSTGIFAGAGVRVSGVLSIEGEWHRTGKMEAIEPSRYFITYSLQRRDTLIGAGPRFHLRLGPGVVLEPVALVEFVREESWIAQRTDPPGLPSTGDLETHVPFVNSWGKGFAAGADVRIGSEHVAILPGVRFHRFWRDGTVDKSSSTWPGGVSSRGMEITVALRADF